MNRRIPTAARRGRRVVTWLPLTLAALLCAFVSVADDFRRSNRRTGLSAMRGQQLEVTYDIAPGYYRIRSARVRERDTRRHARTPSFPAGEDHEDEYFGKQVIYRHAVTVPMQVTFAGAARDFDVKLKAQGCADAGRYPPTTWTTHVPRPCNGLDVGRCSGIIAGGSSNRAVDLQQLLSAKPSGEETRFLKADQAFAFSADSPGSDRVTLDWEIADGYYLYRDRISVKTSASDVQLGAPRMPSGESHHDDYFGEQVVYRKSLSIDVRLAKGAAGRELPVEVSYQGCADAGLCYPPIRKQVTITLAPMSAAEASEGAGDRAPVRSEQDTLRTRSAAAACSACSSRSLQSGSGFR
jgi:thiol:disulfide interchange protein DsbD